MNNRKIKSLIRWPLLALFLLPFSLFAEEEKPAALAEMWVVEVDGKDFGAFEKAFKEHMKVRAKKGDPRHWQVYTAHTGNNMNRYYIRTCCFKWEDKDAYAKWGNESKIGEHWNNGAGQYAQSYAHHYSWVDHKNSHWPENKAYKFIGVRSYKVIPGSKIGKSVKAISKLAKDMGWNESWSWAYGITGSGNLSLAFPFENFADMSPPSPSFREKAVEHLGSEEKVDEIFDRFSKTFKSSHYTIYSYRRDLSSQKE